MYLCNFSVSILKNIVFFLDFKFMQNNVIQNYGEDKIIYM